VSHVCVCVSVSLRIYIEECLLRELFLPFFFLWLLQVCLKAANPSDKNRRLNTSILVRHSNSTGTHNILIDAGKYVSTLNFPCNKYVLNYAMLWIRMNIFFLLFWFQSKYVIEDYRFPSHDMIYNRNIEWWILHSRKREKMRESEFLSFLYFRKWKLVTYNNEIGIHTKSDL
jgi:hypothetical protein